MGYIEYKVSGDVARVAYLDNADGHETVKTTGIAQSPAPCGELEQTEGTPFMAQIKARGANATSRVIVAIYEDGKRVAAADAYGTELAECTHAVTT